MAPAATAKPARKRVRKRKRRAASSDSSSSSSSDSSSDSDAVSPPVTAKAQAAVKAADSDSDSEEETSSSSSDSDADSDVSMAPPATKQQSAVTATAGKQAVPTQQRYPSRSPSPPIAVPTPSFLPSKDAPDFMEKEQALKNKFRKLWMSTVADTFRNDLEEIRKASVIYFI